MRNYERLRVWEKSHQLVLDVCQATASFPPEERHGLISQLRRSALSIPSNIAEGYGRSGDAEPNRFLVMAQGSSNELSYQLLVSRDLKYLETRQHKELDDNLREIQKMLVALRKRLRTETGE